MADPWDDLFNHPGAGRETPLHRRIARLREAVLRGNMDGAEEVLAEDPAAARSIDCLHEAVRRGDADMVGLLLRNGAPAGTPDESGITPLWLAASGGHGSVVRLLVRSGADPNVTPEAVDPEITPARHGESPLLFAALWGDAELVRFLWRRTSSTVRELARSVMRDRLRLLDVDEGGGGDNVVRR